MKNSKLEDTIKSVEPKIRYVEKQFLEADKTIQGHHRTSSYSLIHMQPEFLKHKQKAHLKGQLQISKIDQNPKSQI